MFSEISRINLKKIRASLGINFFNGSIFRFLFSHFVRQIPIFQFLFSHFFWQIPTFQFLSANSNFSIPIDLKLFLPKKVSINLYIFSAFKFLYFFRNIFLTTDRQLVYRSDDVRLITPKLGRFV